jgi:hypothetical protein
MKRCSVDLALARINVRAASLLVPRTDRAGWTAEWAGELHHLSRAAQEGAAPESSRSDPLQFSLGAYHDAFWICCDRVRAEGLPTLRSGSAARCGLVLVVAAAAALLLALALPGARNALLRLPYRRSADLVLISSHGYTGTQSPSIALADYEEWTTDTAPLFTEIAFYRPTVKGVYLAHHEAEHLAVAQASDNLLQLLDPPLTGGVATVSEPGEPRLVLRRSAWRTLYGGDPHLIGRTADIDGRPVLIAAILPDDDWRLPGKIDALLLEDQVALAALPSRTKGFVIARIRDSAFPPPHGGWRKMVENRDGVTRGFDCISVAHLLHQPSFVFLFALLLASLALPATTALPLGEYPRRHDRLPVTVNARRWAFLLVKFALVIVLVDLFSTDLAYGLYSPHPLTALYLQLATAFPALLFGFRWILQDQRRRCPQCLGLLSNPARVGQASCNFLSWNGTELFCIRGHGLLHIPELPTSWFSTQRWLCLDSSWRCLFPESGSPSPGMV